MLTLPQIIAKTPASRLEGAGYVRLLKVQMGYDDDHQAFVAAQSYSTHVLSPTLGRWIRDTNRPKYVTMITFLDKQLHCKVSCSCDDFLFTWETSLKHKGAADIEYSNGELPREKNPKMVPAMCKHLCAIYNMIKPKLTPVSRRK